jgi:hypothetical protein
MSYPGNDDSRTNESDQPPAPSVTDWIPSQPTGEATPPPSPPSPFTPGTDQPTAGGRPFVAAPDSYQPVPPSPAPFAASQTDPTTGQNPPVPVAPPSVAPTPVATPVPLGAPGPTTGSIPTPQYAAGPPTMGQPPVGQPYVPVPSPPTYDPAAVAQPYSAQPYSVQPYSVQPYSVAPASGAYAYGIPSAVPVPESKRRRTGVVVLSVLTTLFVLAAGVMTTLFVLTKQEADRLDGQVQRLGVETTDQRQKINTLQTDLDNTKRDLTDSQSETKEVADQKAKVSACVKSFLDLLAALNRSNGQTNAEVQRLDRAFSATCNEAEKYLD